MTFRCANGIRQGRQLSPLLYNVHTDDLNHYLQAKGVGCYVGDAWANSLNGWYGVTCTHGNSSSVTLGDMSGICWSHDIVYNTTKTVCTLVRESNQRVGSQQLRVRLGNEELSFVEEFHYLGHIMTADCRDDKDIKKQFSRQNAVGNMLVRKFSFVPIEPKIQLFKSDRCTIYGCALWNHSFQNSIRKLTVSNNDTFKRLINVPRFTSSSLAFEN